MRYDNLTLEDIVVYDIEVFPNLFTCVLTYKKKLWTFEISERKNDCERFKALLTAFKLKKTWMCGFNNVTYDYQILHTILTTPTDEITNDLIYKKSKFIFNTKDKLRDLIWEWKQEIPQLDLFRLMHFNNKARITSLKKLQFNMRMDSIVEYQGDFDSPVPLEKIPEVIGYNKHDVISTRRFMQLVFDEITFRSDESIRSKKNMMCKSATAIGEKFIIDSMIKKIGYDKIYSYENDKREKIQTFRTKLMMAQIMLPKIGFERPELKAFKEYISKLTVHVLEGGFHWTQEANFVEMYHEIYKKKDKDLTAEQKKLKKASDDKDIKIEMDGFKFVFAKGGLHGAVKKSNWVSKDGWSIIDVDVKAYYASMAYLFKFFPEHLGVELCDFIFEKVEERSRLPKTSLMNKIIKIMLVSFFGLTNSVYSELYDPKYTITTTVNGQLFLLKLYEMIKAKCKESKIMQANTDGLTFYVKDCEKQAFEEVITEWENWTKMKMEYSYYSEMAMRDVNNYLAIHTSGEVKMKGVYAHDILYDGEETKGIQWHKNHSNIVVKKAVYEEIVHKRSGEAFIRNHKDIFDFFKITPPGAKYKTYLMDDTEFTKEDLELLDPETALPKVTRYLVTTSGHYLARYSKSENRMSAINKNFRATVYNEVVSKKVEDYDIDYEYYIEEFNKILKFKEIDIEE